MCAIPGLKPSPALQTSSNDKERHSPKCRRALDPKLHLQRSVVSVVVALELPVVALIIIVIVIVIIIIVVILLLRRITPLGSPIMLSIDKLLISSAIIPNPLPNLILMHALRPPTRHRPTTPRNRATIRRRIRSRP